MVSFGFAVLPRAMTLRFFLGFCVTIPWLAGFEEMHVEAASEFHTAHRDPGSSSSTQTERVNDRSTTRPVPGLFRGIQRLWIPANSAEGPIAATSADHGGLWLCEESTSVGSATVAVHAFEVCEVLQVLGRPCASSPLGLAPNHLGRQLLS